MQGNAGVLKRAQEAHAGGRLAVAIPLYEQVLRVEPRSFTANYYLGIALYQAGQPARSVAPLKAAAEARPGAVEAHKDLGLILLKLRDFGAAEASLGRALALQPGNPELQVNRGIALKGLGRTADAAICYRKAIEFRPGFAEAHHNLGNALLSLGDAQGAHASFERAAGLRPTYWEAVVGAGQALLELGRAEEAEHALRQATSLNPRAADAHGALGVALLRLDRTEEALAALARALEIDPGHAAALVAKGTVLERCGKHEEALANYDAALEASPDQIDALLGKAGVLRHQQRLDEAIALYDRVISRAPDRAEGYQGAGLAFFRKREFAAAARSFDAAIERDKTEAGLHYMRGRALREIGHPGESLAALDRAIALKPDHVQAHVLKAQILSELLRAEEAIAVLETARQLDAGMSRLFGLQFREKMHIGDWTSYEETLDLIRPRIQAGEEIIDPFLSLSHFDELPLQLRCAEIYAADIVDQSLPPRPMNVALRGGRISIAYVSGDFRDHAMMYLMAELFERHDRSRFHIHGYSLKKDADSAMRKRVMPLFETFHDVDDMSDREILDLARHEEIDIAVDLVAFTRHGRPSLYAAGLAPIQVNYLGYPGTMGMKAMDYIVADKVLIPEGSRGFYSEKIAYLPDAYQPNDRKRKISEKIFTREELGLPAEGFVFCCFNNSFKITPPVFASWMRILRQTPGSVLWLLAYAPAVERNLRRAAEAEGVDGERLVFAKVVDTAEHIARQRAADLFIDTLPYNAHTTASDALWAGLPLLTRMGETFASRVAASLLTAAGLPEMIAPTIGEFERMAVMLAHDRERLASVRARLEANRMSCALFDSERHTRGLEALFTQMIERRRAGLPAEHLFS